MEAAAAGSLGRPAGWNSAWRRKTNIFVAMTTLLTLYFIGAGVAFLICTRTFASFSPDSQEALELFPGLNCSGFEKPAGLMQLQAVLEEFQVPPHALADPVVVEANVTANITYATTLQADDGGEPEFMQNPVTSWDKRAQATSFTPDSQAPVELFPGLNSSGFEKPAGPTQQQAVLEELQVPPHALADRVVVEADVTANMITNATTLQADEDGEAEFMQNPAISWDTRAQAPSFSPDSQAPVELLPGLNSSSFEKPAGPTQQQAVLEELQVPLHALADPVVVEANVTANMITNATTLQADDDGEPEFMQKPAIDWDKRDQAEEVKSRLKLMSSAERGRWVQENWPSFMILTEDNVSEQFDDRMREFLCNSNSTAHPAAFGNSSSGNATSSLRHKIDETHLCAPNPSSFCTERFFLTWISPVESFSPRERLGLESIFKHQPSACVVILSRAMDSDAGRAILASFLARGYRVMAVTPDVKSLFSGTPAAKWLSGLRDGTGDPGCINLMQNLSNLMRLATIYKYGGVYLDTDVIVVKSFSPLRNAVGAQRQELDGQWTDLNNAVIVFDRKHPFVLELLQEFQATFNGSRWGWNGPSLFSRVATKVLQDQKWRNCSDVAVLPREAFYPIIWEDIIKFFHKPTEGQENKTLQVEEMSRITNGTYSVHLWNQMSCFLRVQPGSGMEALCKRSCLFCK